MRCCPIRGQPRLELNPTGIRSANLNRARGAAHHEEIVAYRFKHKGKGTLAISVDAEGKDFPDPLEWQKEEAITITRSNAPGQSLDSTTIDHLKAHSFVILAEGSNSVAVVAPRKDDRGD